MGEKLRNEVYASIYLRQSDSAREVQTQARLVWKATVWNPGRMVKNVIQALLDNIVEGLMKDEDTQDVIFYYWWWCSLFLLEL